MIYSNVMIMDADFVCSVVTKEIVRSMGGEIVDVAGDVTEALELMRLSDRPYDLIICDLHMPNMDGMSFLRMLSCAGYQGGMIVLSAEDDNATETVMRLARLQNIDVLGAIRKPLGEKVLKALLEAEGRSADTGALSASLSHSDVAEVLAGGCLAPFYQPKFNLVTNRADSAEVLCRLIRGEGEACSPEALIAAAEDHDLITELTECVVEGVVRDLLRWRRIGQEVKVSVNVSPSSLMQPDFPERISAPFDAAGVDKRLVTLEITRHRSVTRGVDMLDVLSSLRGKGFRLSLDSLDACAASVEKLRLYPLNELKVGKSLVMHALTDHFAREGLEASFRLARQLGLKVVAEGVESAEAYTLVKQMGADEVQGYLVSRPMSSQSYLAWLEEVARRGAMRRAAG